VRKALGDAGCPVRHIVVLAGLNRSPKAHGSNAGRMTGRGSASFESKAQRVSR
jgi:hypothetical protein